jgi:peptide/nickel transport system permease protein
MEGAATLSLSPARPRWRRSMRLTLRNRLVFAGGLLVALLSVVALFAPVVAPDDPIATDAAVRLQSPSWDHLFGTDRFGRDVLSRVIYGSRISLWVSLTSVAIATFVGTILGLASGYFGHWTDHVISRLLDILFSFPGLLLAIAIAAFLGPGQNNAIIAIAVVYSPLIARVVRGSVLAERHKEYVEAARMIGSRHARVIRRHVLPNVLSPIIVQASITLSYAILIEASLSYLGLGTQPPDPSWGTMLNEGRPFLERAPWMSVFPGLSIMLAVFAFNLLGDGLRELFDPRLRSG